MSDVSAIDVIHALDALNVPTSSSVWRPAPNSSRVRVSYTTRWGDLADRGTRNHEQFTAACTHLGLKAHTISRIRFTPDRVTVFEFDNLLRPFVVYDASKGYTPLSPLRLRAGFGR